MDEAGLTLAIPVQGDWATANCGVKEPHVSGATKMFQQSFYSSTEFSLDMERDIFWSPFAMNPNPTVGSVSDKPVAKVVDEEVESRQTKRCKAVNLSVSASSNPVVERERLEKRQDVDSPLKSSLGVRVPAHPARLHTVDSFASPSSFFDDNSARARRVLLPPEHRRSQRSLGGASDQPCGSLQPTYLFGNETHRSERHHYLETGRMHTSIHPNFSVGIGDHVEEKRKLSKKQRMLSAFSKLLRCTPFKGRKKEQAAMQQIQAECNNSTRQIRTGTLYLKRQASLTKAIEEKLNDTPCNKATRVKATPDVGSGSVRERFSDCPIPLPRRSIKNHKGHMKGRRGAETPPPMERSPRMRVKVRKSLSLGAA